jgi:4-diphosphocytidyl-2-C-methyl-D-erythritol kinase
MADEVRRARVRALAKLNLSLEVLHKREDGFHELRTIFQTVSLADSLEIEFTPGKRTSILLDSDVAISGNLVEKAAEAIARKTRAKGKIALALRKKIPMGGGLGGGSTDAAAVLLALPALMGSKLSFPLLHELGTELGSDVPFFLYGGTALGLGRGTELYPLQDTRPTEALIVSSGLYVSTPLAFKSLTRNPLTLTQPSHKIRYSQPLAMALADKLAAEEWGPLCRNDFEAVVFEQHPVLAKLRRKLEQAGAVPARMTGSGSAIFGVFESRAAAKRGSHQLQSAFTKEKVYPVSFVSRARYRAMWWRQLGEHIQDQTWPPRSRYSE